MEIERKVKEMIVIQGKKSLKRKVLVKYVFFLYLHGFPPIVDDFISEDIHENRSIFAISTFSYMYMIGPSKIFYV